MFRYSGFEKLSIGDARGSMKLEVRGLVVRILQTGRASKGSRSRPSAFVSFRVLEPS